MNGTSGLVTRVADIGTGSGILAAAAALLGADRVIGCDIDPDAVEIAHERVRLPMFVGSASAIRSGWADVVIANIDAATIEDLAAELARIRKPDSMLILTGFPNGMSFRRVVSPKEITRNARSGCAWWFPETDSCV